MSIEIRETIVMPDDADHDVVQLHISDAASVDESATFDIRILVKTRALLMPTLGHLQRQAMATAQDALTPLLRRLAQEIQEAGYGLELPPKNPRR